MQQLVLIPVVIRFKLNSKITYNRIEYNYEKKFVEYKTIRNNQ